MNAIDNDCNLVAVIQVVSKWTSTVTVSVLLAKLLGGAGKISTWGKAAAAAIQKENFYEAGRIIGEAAAWVLAVNVNDVEELFA